MKLPNQFQPVNRNNPLIRLSRFSTSNLGADGVWPSQSVGRLTSGRRQRDMAILNCPVDLCCDGSNQCKCCTIVLQGNSSSEL